ncbi:hypothetical protein [Gordonia sp. FQ]|uniref:hypothetical protein n=1 Tax=Gordonia sp. FQ TaxID=3446634 RepID=UPI003F878E90
MIRLSIPAWGAVIGALWGLVIGLKTESVGWGVAAAIGLAVLGYGIGFAIEYLLVLGVGKGFEYAGRGIYKLRGKSKDEYYASMADGHRRAAADEAERRRPTRYPTIQRGVIAALIVIGAVVAITPLFGEFSWIVGFVIIMGGWGIRKDVSPDKFVALPGLFIMAVGGMGFTTEMDLYSDGSVDSHMAYPGVGAALMVIGILVSAAPFGLSYLVFKKPIPKHWDALYAIIARRLNIAPRPVPGAPEPGPAPFGFAPAPGMPQPSAPIPPGTIPPPPGRPVPAPGCPATPTALTPPHPVSPPDADTTAIPTAPPSAPRPSADPTTSITIGTDTSRPAQIPPPIQTPPAVPEPRSAAPATRFAGEASVVAPLRPQDLHDLVLRAARTDQAPPRGGDAVQLLENRRGLVRLGYCAGGVAPVFVVDVAITPDPAGARAELRVAHTVPRPAPQRGVVDEHELTRLLAAIRGGITVGCPTATWGL